MLLLRMRRPCMGRSKRFLAFEDRRSCHLFLGGRAAEVKGGRLRQRKPAEGRRKAAEVKDAPSRDQH
eukprot:1130435-Pyramimonas_sp.AAC.1